MILNLISCLLSEVPGDAYKCTMFFTITKLVSALMLRKLPFVFVLVFVCIFFFNLPCV